MRKLTIKRTKSFIGCLGVMKVYIESADGDTKIGNALCKKLGNLKNGEELCCEIGNEEAKIYVIADKLSTNFCVEGYKLDAGEQDITLTGRNRFNPMAGNAFRFDGNDSSDAIADRKKSIKRGGLVMICSILIGLAVGFGLTTAVFEIIGSQEESFSAEELTITLNKHFVKQSAYPYAGAFASNDVDILVLKKKFTSITSSKLSAEEYTKMFLEYNKLDYKTVKVGDITTYEYSKMAKDGVTYKYHIYSYKTKDAYWQVYFAVKESRADRYADDIVEWAKSIEFN